MKVLFAVSNEEISQAIIKKYQKEYKEIISHKNVYYFNAILKEIQKDKTYDRIVISEDLESFSHKEYDQIDKFIFEKLDSISDEASNMRGDDIPIILICSDRRTKSEQMLVKLFGIGVYNAILGNDRSVDEVCRLINRPRSKKEAKNYYKIDSEEVNYQAENENDVSEMEIQNILAHYKSLGKDENRYVDSFNNIATQYNDVQLRVICKFLPLNVRAVLEERSPKYQKVMSFNNRISSELRSNVKNKKESGTSEKLLRTKKENITHSTPVVIPSSLNMNEAKKLSRRRNTETNLSMPQEIENEVKIVNPTPTAQTQIRPTQMQTSEYNIEQARLQTEQEGKKTSMPVEVQQEYREPEIEPTVKRGRGRPRKTPVVEETQPTVKRGRGRPRKVQPQEEIVKVAEEENEDVILPGFENIQENNVIEDNITLPGLEQETEEQEDIMLPGFDRISENTKEDNNIINNDDSIQEESMYINQLQNNNTYNYNSVNQQRNNNTYNYNSVNQQQNSNSYNYNSINQDYRISVNDNYVQTVDISSLLTSDKKIVSFVGTSKNGTSFIVNNVAELLSSMGINVTILDTTKNRNSYYIYTKNEEELRNIAAHSIEGLSQGVANGIQVNKNLTVYTSLPDERESINNVDKILETLVKNYSAILIDCDFETPIGYFKQSQETYLVQSLDILTIQPLTAFLRELKAKNVLEENKLKIILNKFVRIRGINEKTIIGGMAFYNDPAMSFMTELFDRNTINYITIPFEEEIYIKYLEEIINCDINLKGYSKTFMQILRQLANIVYPLVSGKGTYRPPSIETNNQMGTFSPEMNNTLNQMKNNF